MANIPLICVVDDDISVREALVDRLESLAFVAVGFSGAAELLRSESLSLAACLIVDVQMPGMGGLELHQHLIKAGRNIPTILITAYPDERVRAKAQRLAALGFLAKPFDDSELIALISEGISRGSGIRSLNALPRRAVP